LTNIIVKSHDIGVKNDSLTFESIRSLDFLNGIRSTSLRTKSVRTIQKIGLKYWFDYQFGRHLTDSVKYDRNP